MITRLRQRFIFLAIAATLLVLTVLIGSINVINYVNVIRQADTTLAYLAENNGNFSEEFSGKKDGFPGGGSPELPFESRYFTVQLDTEGNVQAVDVRRIHAVDEESAKVYGRTAGKKTEEKGFQDHYRFLKVDKEEGTFLIFLDCWRDLERTRSFLFASVGVSLLGWLAVWGLVAAFSGRIVRPVAESHEKQKRFITDAGHEIKTPLAIIEADAAVLEMQQGENEWLSDIQLQTRRLAGLTEDLIYLARMEEEGRKREWIEFPVSEVAQEVGQSFSALAKVQGKELQIEIEEGILWKGEEKKISQLFTILLDNALKYSPEGGKVSFTLKKEQRVLCLEVWNQSDSISREDLPYLFDRFYRSDPSRNSATGGHGIGLSIALAIVKAHKGKIYATSADGKSLRMTARLPE
ncbi:sensor histidine kinase [Suipraeoptans intestinalis]|uniref:sensor histidine kinase n=1 Tax=Suipraeoptans intestinalis TaxID=2606628 RepID=UPI0023F1866D|nr:HAMP domain-containing sensor histidine kinase [Suipraeoptans intestinalis]MDD7769776.1 HAMP domain-containing sensor histidine kinase [Suipraeoptans intestinalis]